MHANIAAAHAHLKAGRCRGAEEVLIKFLKAGRGSEAEELVNKFLKAGRCREVGSPVTPSDVPHQTRTEIVTDQARCCQVDGARRRGGQQNPGVVVLSSSYATTQEPFSWPVSGAASLVSCCGGPSK